jgi:5-methylcytosine-specific restriction endonuclease McrA
MAVYRATYREKHIEKERARVREWGEKNKPIRRAIDQNRRARKRATGGELSNGLVEKLFDLQRGKCACCKQPLGDDYHLDHIMPLALGGSNTDNNMQLLRSTCNQQKHAKHPVDFMQSRGMLL